MKKISTINLLLYFISLIMIYFLSSDFHEIFSQHSISTHVGRSAFWSSPLGMLLSGSFLFFFIMKYTFFMKKIDEDAERLMIRLSFLVDFFVNIICTFAALKSIAAKEMSGWWMILLIMNFLVIFITNFYLKVDKTLPQVSNNTKIIDIFCRSLFIIIIILFCERIIKIHWSIILSISFLIASLPESLIIKLKQRL